MTPFIPFSIGFVAADTIMLDIIVKASATTVPSSLFLNISMTDVL